MKLTNYEKLKLDILCKSGGGILEIVEEESHYIGVNYKIKLVDNPFIDVEFHPLNLTKTFIGQIEEILDGRKVQWNNTKTTFWV